MAGTAGCASELSSTNCNGGGNINRSYLPSTSHSTSSTSSSAEESTTSPSSLPTTSLEVNCDSLASFSTGPLNVNPASSGSGNVTGPYASISLCSTRRPDNAPRNMTSSQQQSLRHARSFPSTSFNRYNGSEQPGTAEAADLLSALDLQVTEELKATNRRQTVIFKVLVALCAIVFIIYIVVIAVLIASWLSKDSNTNGGVAGPSGQTGLEASGCSPTPVCINQKELDDFVNALKRTSNSSLVHSDILPDNYRVTNGKYCFDDLSWVPITMAKIYSEVLTSVEKLETRQTGLNESIMAVREYTHSNNTGVCKSGSSTSSDRDPNQAVFAHFVVDVNKTYGTGTALASVQFMREGEANSAKSQMEVNTSRGEITVRHAGTYFLYSHLTFKQNGGSQVHRIRQTSTHSTGEQTILETRAGKDSVLQGTFNFQQHDKLTIQATAGELLLSSQNDAYVGIYLIRT